MGWREGVRDKLVQRAGMLQQLFKALYVLPGPYAPIIPLGRGPCGHASKAGERRRRWVGEKEKGG